MESLFSQLHNRERHREVLRNLLIILSAGNKQSEALKCLAPAEGIVTALIDLIRGQNHDLSEPDESDMTSGNGEALPGHASTTRGVSGRQSEGPSLTVLALGCLYHICDGPPSRFWKYVNKTFVSTLLSYFIPDFTPDQDTLTVNRFFQFGPSYTTAMRRVLSSSLRDGTVMVRVDEDSGAEVHSEKKTTDSDLSSKVLRYLETDLRFYEPLLQGKSADVKFCQVQILKDTETANLADQLIAKGAAWPLGNKITPLQEYSKTNNDRDGKTLSKYVPAKVTNILKGNFFWMIVGEAKIQQAEMLKSILFHRKAELINLVPKKLDAVVAEVMDAEKAGLVRARVLDISGVVITVQDLDTGCVYHVSMCNIYSLPASLNLTTVPPLATLACLKDVLPAPLDVRAPELAAGALGLIVRQVNVTAVNLILQSGVLSSLPGLVMCPDSEVAYRTLELVACLTSHRIQHVRAASWNCLIPGSLATLRRCMQKTIDHRAQPCAGKSDPLKAKNARNKALVESCMACLANCMFMSCKGKSQCYQNRGLETIIQAYVLYYNDHSIRRLCFIALTNYVYFKKAPDCGLQNRRYKGARVTSPPSKSTTTQKAQAANAKKDNNVESDASELQEDDGSDALAESFSSMDSHGNSSLTSDDSTDGATLPKKFYIRGDKVPFSQDATHELQQTAKPGSQDFAAIICGMLNTGRVGTIYLGLDPKDLSVVGVSMDYDARDEMRMSVDHLMVEQLSPSVLHLQFHMEFVPVMEVPARTGVETTQDADVGDGGDAAENPAVFHLGHEYVVEIQVKPLPNVIYCCSGKECFYRLDGQTVVLDCQLIRQLLVLEEEAEHVEEIVTLQHQVEKLKAEMAALNY